MTKLLVEVTRVMVEVKVIRVEVELELDKQTWTLSWISW